MDGRGMSSSVFGCADGSIFCSTDAGVDGLATAGTGSAGEGSGVGAWRVGSAIGVGVGV